MKKEKTYEIKKIVKEFKSKNGIPLFAYIGVWHGANGDEEIKYIERKDTREYISSFIEKGETPKYSSDKTLNEEVKRLKKILILEYFEYADYFGGFPDNYKFSSYGKEFNMKKIVEELKLLMEEKKKIEFNEDYGVGKVNYKNNKFVIELHIYGHMSFPVITKDLKEVAKWLWSFSNDEDAEPFDYGKAMRIAFTKDTMSGKDKDNLKSDYENKVSEAFAKIK